ncbi:YecA family protein [Brevundimonas viscosa]|uniref:SEC-C motif-containing protein n=1 Tax=Brevundimonas viscosa TaxID=871741 RepID=A0A1I6PQR0_9CAUL|nr:SEC-C domain-containing protein [Brevundimonas viscosa]SFS42460.1 hypothetical protein SAMN05192570_1184 [Brevundimonas viscosa]
MAKQKQPAPPRVSVSAARFHEHLAEQVGYLEASCSGFDEGRTAEFKRIAAAVRTVVHDTGSSTSLLTHLGEKGIQFVSSGFPYDDGNLMSHHGLIGIVGGSGRNGYVALCQTPGGGPLAPRELAFDAWWNEPVIKDGSNRMLRRRDLVLIAANQDGGAHVDGTIDETYDDLARRNSLGWMFSDGQTETPLEQAEAYSIRQIGWEVLETLRRREARLIANEKCQCGSGRKHRYCCGKPAAA